MVHLTRSSEDAVRLLDDKIASGETLQLSCSKVQANRDLDKVIDEYEVWENSCAGLLRVIFDDESISKEFKETGFVSYDLNRSFAEDIHAMHTDIKQSVSKLKSVKSDILNGVYENKPKDIPEPNPTVASAKIARSSAIIVALITACFGFLTAYIAIPSKPPTQLQKQGFENLSIEGKWKYICTDYNGLYQHGGRFTVSKNSLGAMQLSGERMWRNTYDSLTKSWIFNEFKGTSVLTWKSRWIYVHNVNDFNMEYEIIVNGESVKGYCTANIVQDHNQIQKMDGSFYQLLPRTPLLAGTIKFIKVTDYDYDNPVWSKNEIIKNK